MPFRKTCTRLTPAALSLLALSAALWLSGCAVTAGCDRKGAPTPTPANTPQRPAVASWTASSGPSVPEPPQDLNRLAYRPLVSLTPTADFWQQPKYPAVARLTPVDPDSIICREPAHRHGRLVHKVRPGDTLFSISQRYYRTGRYHQLICTSNRDVLSSPQSLQVGQLLYLPVNPLDNADGTRTGPAHRPDYYVAAPGDTLQAIAASVMGRRTDWPRLARLNHLDDPAQLAAGMRLRIPHGTTP